MKTTDSEDKPVRATSEPLATFSTRPDRTHWSHELRIPKPTLGKKGSGDGRKMSLQAFKARLVILFAICLLFGFGGGLLGATVHEHVNNSTTLNKSASQRYVSSESQLIAGIAKNVGQSVVSVNVSSQVTTQSFFGQNQTQSQEAAGTGFILSSDGIIMTNRHVVPVGTTSVSVTLSDGTNYDNVQVIGRTSDSSSLDVAFLKLGDLKGEKLTPVTLGDSSKIQVGDRVIAIGNALGQFQNTVTSGIISGYGRDLTAGDQSGDSTENLTDLFQTDAAINEGNSGGPLVDINGNVIGLNTAVAANAQSIGFSIPINDLKGIITSVLKNGQLQQPYLGVRYVSITPDVANQYNLSVKNGAYIISGDDGTPAVVSGSPADKAGLQEKDIITKVDDTVLNEKTGLSSALGQHQVGDNVTLTVIRGGKTIQVRVTLANTPDTTNQ